MQDAPFLACAAEPGAPHRAMVSQQGASLTVYNLATSRVMSEVSQRIFKRPVSLVLPLAALCATLAMSCDKGGSAW